MTRPERRAEVVPLRRLPPPDPARRVPDSRPAADVEWSKLARWAVAVALSAVVFAALVGGLRSFASMIF